MQKQRIIDISLPLQEPMRGFKKDVAKTLKKDGWNASSLEIYSHAGTHMDAPLHFDVSEAGIDSINPERFISNCHIIRLVPAEPKMLIGPEHVAHIDQEFQPGESIIFHTGWGAYANDPAVYRDSLPRISSELANWLVKRKVNILGVEPPSIADVNNLEELKEVHTILLEGDVLILEGLCNLDSVEGNRVSLIALPLKIKGCDGAPVRAIVIEN